MTPLFENLGIALLLGLLVGLQREHVTAELAGLRTFPMITVLGTVSAYLDGLVEGSGWVIAAGMLSVVVVVIAEKLRQPPKEKPGGITTEISIVLMFAVGALLVLGYRTGGVAVGVGVAALLQFKPELHGFAARLGDNDLRAIMQFGVITFVILPVLPNRTFGPLDVFNPFQTWLMVSLIVGISLGGYVAYKFFGDGVGVVLAGILGGAISSTATTVSYARRTRGRPAGAELAALAILIASSVVYVRVLVEVAAVAPSFLPAAAPPILTMMALQVVWAAWHWLSLRRQQQEMPEQENPSELRAALAFAGVFTLVLFALAAAREFARDEALYVVAALSGLSDMDAITLSTSRLVDVGRVEAEVGWRILVIATISNLAFKGAIAGVLGSARLRRAVLSGFALPMLGGAVLLAVWRTPW